MISRFDNFGDLTGFTYNELQKLAEIKSKIPRKFLRRQTREILNFYFSALKNVKYFGKLEQEMEKADIRQEIANVRKKAKEVLTEPPRAESASTREITANRLTPAEKKQLEAGKQIDEGETDNDEKTE